MPTRSITSREFAFALRQITPSKGQTRFLQAHYRATGRVTTTTNLARSAGYQNYGGVNLQYGGLAKRIAKILRRPVPEVRATLLVEFVEREKLSNRNWILHMRPAFARGLRSAGWVK